MYAITFKDGFGKILVEDIVEKEFSFSVKFKLRKKIVICGNELNDIEWVTIPKNVVEKITALEGPTNEWKNT